MISLASFAVKVDAFGLSIELVGTMLCIRHTRTKVQPIQPVEDRIERRLRVPLDVGIVDPQDHRARVVAGVQPVEDKGPGAADEDIQ